MQTVRTIAAARDYLDKARREGKTVGFVPTMGYLHEGHLSLVRAARREVDTVVVSIFVNPIQFGPREDLKDYPRDLARDEKLCASERVDLVFAPSAGEMYPDDSLTFVEVENLEKLLCGKTRPTHFRGVTTVVAKLFGIVQPHLAYFGQKDAQQAIIIKRMVEDLNLPLKIRVLPTVREEDGLAMSSRNSHLTPEEREKAPVLYRSLKKAEELIKGGERNDGRVREEMKKMIDTVGSTRLDYIAIVNPRNLEDLEEIEGEVLIALAVCFPSARLIDNLILGTTL